MTDQTVIPPPARLLHDGRATPDARAVLAEVRSDASLPFDPNAAPGYLRIVDSSFGALVTWRVDLSWSDAQQVQLWLIGAPAGGAFPTREEALGDFFETLVIGAPPQPYIEYIGTYLTTGISHASYTVLLGMRVPVLRDEYQTSFVNALNALLAAGGPAGWYAELVEFLRLILNQPSSREEFLTLASNIGDLAQTVAGVPRFPLIQTLIT
jgi:hypothetical protein